MVVNARIQSGAAVHPTARADEVRRVLEMLGGEGAVGDVMAVTALSSLEVSAALDALLVDGNADVRVTEAGDVTYFVRRLLRRRLGEPNREPRASFDRKTIQLIRAREGVISLAELIEHTGLSLARAEAEMHRLAMRYGGVPHVSLDGHVVHAFPDLMTSIHGRFGLGEPRPAWVRRHDPMVGGRGGLLGRLLRRFGRWVDRQGGVRIWRPATVRRYLLGLVTESALAGKGIVSLDRAVLYLARRTGGGPVPRRIVERALRQLAKDFDASITEVDGHPIFGFRNVKRQFLAGHLVRRELRLGRVASGETVFDSSDPPLTASARDLRLFDQALGDGTRHLTA